MEIRLEGISKSFGNKSVLQGISFEISEGQTYAVIGKNGAGKSTLFNIICGLVKQDSGDIFYDDQVHAILPTAIKKKIGFLGEQGTALDELQGIQFLNLVGHLYGVSDIDSNTNSLVQYFFEDGELDGKIIREYSSGMRKKIELCSVLIHEPEVLILDEPFIGLDSLGVEKLIQYLRTYRADKGYSLVFSTHQMDYFERLNPEIILLHNHKIRYHGDIGGFKESYGDSIHEGLLNIYSQ